MIGFHYGARSKKYYKVKNTLNGGEAVDYLHLLTEVRFSQDEMLRLIEDGSIDCYIKPASPLSPTVDISLVTEERQKIVPNPTNMKNLYWDGQTAFSSVDADSELIFSPYTDGVDCFQDVELYGTIEGITLSEGKAKWKANALTFNEDGEYVFFLRADVEALAAEMNDKSDLQVLQEENQRLQQELKDLKGRYTQMQEAARVATDFIDDGTAALRGLNDNELKEIANKLNNLQLEVIEAQKKNAELRAELDRLQTVSKDGGGLLGYESENLRLAEWAINEFYHPDMFDINDPKTYPKQEFMVSEIMRVHGVSGATAKAIERVITPFSRDRAKK